MARALVGLRVVAERVVDDPAAEVVVGPKDGVVRRPSSMRSPSTTTSGSSSR